MVILDSALLLMKSDATPYKKKKHLINHSLKKKYTKKKKENKPRYFPSRKIWLKFNACTSSFSPGRETGGSGAHLPKLHCLFYEPRNT